ncbi:major facilitator superfamily domain-containing protein [Aspergillus pseudonomiae]|uniref:Major facilitator superfamily domain-containing protein n=1 Tax=Aspergillus pseudonomiae TaxID=1506151 RepID=A0A5N7D999_9EURO|nr:major facilitator superfamily domain-containing protein [Aspergillus pseudonomiae]KAE8403011.1 major facilitator superfamily domain-containing protein [Aspergillus pseudonomiae]
MGFFGKKDPCGDEIKEVPIMSDPEKQQPVHHNDVQTALPQIPPTVIAGMEDDLDLSGNRYAWLLTIFYISYVVFEFGAFMWKIMPPHRWAAITVLSWGIVATCQAAVQNWEGLMALRFLLGMSEAAFGPGTPYLLSFFYRRHELGFRCGLFVSAAPLANTFAGALAYGITSGHSKLANWRLLFLVEGSPSLLAAILAWRFLPDSPSKARFLTEEEKEVARARSLQQSGERERSNKINWRELAETLTDAKAWLTALMYFSCNVSFSSLPVFLPTILKDMGFTSINAQGLTAPPYFASFLVTIATTWIADRLQQRGLMLMVLSLIGAIGYVLLATCTSVGARYAGVFLAAIGVFPCIANILPWALNNQGSDSRRGMGIVILNLIGQCGPFLGTNVFPESDGPRYIRGQSICAAFMFFTMILALALRTLLVWENRRLDKQHGTQAEREARGWNKGENVAEENYGAGFRNGIRFSITDISPPTARTMPTVYQDRAGISLYDAQFAGGARGPIPQDVVEQVVDRLVRFQITCEDFGVPAQNVYVLATEATRTAPNSEEFRARIKHRTGWEVRLLSKEDEGRIGALGIASSASSVAGLAMDLGGGSTQITWVVEKDGVVTTSPRGSFSFPYGAAALTKRLEQAKAEGKKAEKALKQEMINNFQEAYRALEVPEFLLETAKSLGRFDLYLCGGGFRGWGYVLMNQHKVDPYPIPIINGFRVRRGDFHDTVSVLDSVSDSDEKIFGVSKRRASQIPAVAVLVNVIMDALPDITHIQFCQGGVREGFLFDQMPQEVRAQDPLLAASLPYASPSNAAIRGLLAAALPSTSSPTESRHAPVSFSPQLLGALANLLFAHSRVPRESRSAVALHSTTTGILASVNTLSHVERALIALILCERWAGDLAPTDEVFHRQLSRCVSKQEAWWCQYLGRVATLIGDVHPSGRVSDTHWRIQLETEWESIVKKKDECDLLRLKVKCNNAVAAAAFSLDSLQERAEKVEKAGKKKNWPKDYGVRVGVTIC